MSRPYTSTASPSTLPPNLAQIPVTAPLTLHERRLRHKLISTDRAEHAGHPLTERRDPESGMNLHAKVYYNLLPAIDAIIREKPDALVHAGVIEFLGIWEQLNNPAFNPIEFDGIRKQAGLNSFVLTPKQWIEMTHARGIIAKPGRYGGTFAHKDIAFEFASWISVEFKLEGLVNIFKKTVELCKP